MSFQGETSTEKQFEDPYFGAGTVKICGLTFSHTSSF